MAGRRRAGSCWAITLACCLALSMAPIAAQQAEAPQERDARLARQGAGLFVGGWWPEFDDSAADASVWPYFGGYFQRGLDRHLALESSAGLYRRQETETSSTRDTYIVPLLTGIKFHPFTTPEQSLEPYLSGAIGVALGIENVDGGGGLFGTGSGVTMETGFGFQAGAGIVWHASNALGLAGRGGYQWLRFGNTVGPTGTYRGFLVTAGLTYRFQY